MTVLPIIIRLFDLKRHKARHKETKDENGDGDNCSMSESKKKLQKQQLTGKIGTYLETTKTLKAKNGTLGKGGEAERGKLTKLDREREAEEHNKNYVKALKRTCRTVRPWSINRREVSDCDQWTTASALDGRPRFPSVENTTVYLSPAP